MRSIFNFIKSIALYLFGFFKKTVTHVSDLNGDGKVDEEDARIAAEWTKKKASSIGNEAGRLGKEAIRSEMVRDAAAGAAVGAVVTIPIPFIGPMIGVVIGAALGMYKNIIKSGQPVRDTAKVQPPIDVHVELLKLDNLKRSGVLTEEEFATAKKKILSGP